MHNRGTSFVFIKTSLFQDLNSSSLQTSSFLSSPNLKFLTYHTYILVKIICKYHGVIIISSVYLLLSLKEVNKAAVDSFSAADLVGSVAVESSGSKLIEKAKSKKIGKTLLIYDRKINKITTNYIIDIRRTRGCHDDVS